ncbi:PH domain-containing protein [Corynebacterium sp.]|uniref:PH domain-containing protein n=1 Tax=Corynebacterium sp. TaxID=1720 RepID=UPI0026DC2C70|nr:PH domain-containing protein [Corynebacterium sp.]MDO5032841.1 PH domain-containing protein [Corynebacterium sp.]
MTSTNPQSAQPAASPAPATFRPTREHVLGIIILSLIALLSIGWAPKYLAWLFIIPVLGLWWVLRSKTRVDESGISITYAFRGSRFVPWEKCEGVGFQRATAFVSTGGQRLSMPGVTFNSLPKLSEASRGRIPDALSAGRAAADEKVVIIHRDGQQVLLTKEEYAEYLKQHPELDH